MRVQIIAVGILMIWRNRYGWDYKKQISTVGNQRNPIFFIEKRGFERLQGIINKKTDGNKSVITEITEESCQV